MVIATFEPEVSECFQDNSHTTNILKRIQSLAGQCDVVIIAGDDGKRIPAHRLILMGCSDYFTDLFQNSDKREVKLHEFSGDVIEKLIQYCYTGRILLQEDSVKSLLTTAKSVQLNAVADACCDFLERHLHPSNCLGTAILAEKANMNALLQKSYKFICQNFEQICTHSEFLLLNIDQLQIILANDELVAPTEEYVFRSLVKWIEYEPASREVHFLKLLGLVRLPQLQPSFLTSIVEPLCCTKESKDFITETLKNHMLASASDHSKPRKYNTQRLLTVFKEGDKLCIDWFCPLVNKWVAWNTPLEHRQDFCMIMMEDNLLVMGGGRSFETLDNVMSLNLVTMEMSNLSPMQAARRHHCTALLNTGVYVIGGFSSKGPINTVERWDPVEGSWAFVAPMAQNRFCAAAAVLNDRLYVVGGCNLKDFYDSVEYYDSGEDVWKSAASLNKPRRRHGLQAIKGCLYVFGGETWNNGRCEDTETVERYDPEANTWTLISSPLTKGGYTRCASLGSDLFILNRSEFYMRQHGESEEDVKYEKLTMSAHISKTVDFVASPCIVPPQTWLKN